MKIFKAFIYSFIFVLSLFLFNVGASAAEWYEENYNSTIDDVAKTVTLSKYIGNDAVVTVPATVTINSEEYKVVVTSGVFKDNEKVTKVTISDGVVFGETISSLFYRAINLTDVTIGAVDTTELKNISYLFFGCTKLENINIKKFDTSNVEIMNGVFSYCDSLKELDLSGFNTSSVTSMDSIFNSSSSLEKIILGPKTDLHVGKNDPAQGSSFGRGSWKKAADGKIYSSIEICEASSTSVGAAGTYTKVSSTSDEIVPDFTVSFKLGDYKKIEKLTPTSDDKFILVDNGKSLLYKFKVTDAPSAVFNDEVSVLIKDSVTDKDGNKYGLKLTFNNFKYEDSTVDIHEYLYLDLLTITDKNLKVTNYTYATIDDFLTGFVTYRTKINDDMSALSYDIDIKVVDKDGNEVEGSYIFSAYDLDIAAYQDTASDPLFINKFLTNDYGYGSHSEGVNLIKGYDKSTITFAKTNSFLKQLKIDDNTVRITGTRSDNISEYSEFIVKADAKDFKFRWTSGRPAYTLLFAYYQPKSVLVENINTKEELLKDSKFEIYDANNKKVAEWTTDGKEGNSFFLNPGKYIVKQISVIDPYELAKETTFYVDVEDKITIDNKTVEKVVIINDAIKNEESKEEKAEETAKCTTKVIDGKTHYFDTKGNEIDKSEWSNKCQDPVPTGSFAPYMVIGISFVLAIGAFIVVKKQNKLRKI